jgi:riboflavin biosynthesis pyrimidine reductase
MPHFILIRPTRRKTRSIRSLLCFILAVPSKTTTSRGSNGDEISLLSPPPPPLPSSSFFPSDASLSELETSSLTEENPRLQHSATIQHVLDQITKWQHAKYEQQQKKQQQNHHHHKSLPFVTASFAQSLNGILAPHCEEEHTVDGEEEHGLYVMMEGTTTTTTAISATDRIVTSSNTPPTASKKKKTTTTSNYPLSGPSSLVLTHGIRSIHDGILIGGRTLSMDNPRLTNRLWTTITGSNSSNVVQQPVPIILDTHLTHLGRLGSNCRAALTVAKSSNKNASITMIVCCSHQAAMSWKESPIPSLQHVVQILPCRCCSSSRSRTDDIRDDESPTHSSSSQQEELDLKDVLSKLCNVHGIKSIMVEGGATVLTSFLEQNLIDCLCITIAPTILRSGSSLQPTSLRHHIHLPSLQTSRTATAATSTTEKQQTSFPTATGQLEFLQLGSDCCFLCPLLSGWNGPTLQQ